MSDKPVNNTKFYICEVITALVMFAGFFIPASDTLPALGWQSLFIFIGLLIGWTAVGMIIPSILGLVALSFTEMFTIKTAWAAGISAEPIILLILFCVLSKWLENVGFIATFMNWFLSRKSFVGKPWLFVTAFLAVVYVLGFFASLFPAILIAWPFAYRLIDLLGFERRSKFSAFLVFGISVAACMGSNSKPWSTWGIGSLTAYGNAVPEGVLSYNSFLLWTTLVYIFVLVLYILFAKFVLRIDMSPFMNADYQSIAEEYHFNRIQKFACALMLIMVVALLIPEYLPKCALKVFLKNLGAIGIVSIVLVVAGAINHANGKPILDFKNYVKQGVPWEPVFLLIATIPLADALKSPDAGIIAIITEFANNSLGGLPPFAFYAVVAIFLGVATQFSHNVVLLQGIAPIVCAVSVGMGMSPEITVMIASAMLTAALGTPAASTRAGMLFGNVEWIDSKDCYMFGWVTLLFYAIGCCLIGIPLGGILF